MQKSPRYIFIHNVPHTAAMIPLKKKKSSQVLYKTGQNE